MIRVLSSFLASIPLSFLAPPSSGGAAATRPTVYLVFDGASIDRSDLLRWAGVDWPAMVNVLDAEGDGIVVKPFLANQPYREVVIDALLSRLRTSLSAYGIDVVRHVGPVVEGMGATTIFLGPASLSGGVHIACDIDYSNDNLTDIAFVSDETWGSPQATARALADVVMHECGHTWGLYHVNCDVEGTTYPETMGLRYSAPQSSWLQDTGFLDRSFPEYRDHGSRRGPQNSHRVMRGAFGGSRPSSAKEPRLRVEALTECYGDRGSHRESP